MKLTKAHWIGITFAVLVGGIDVLFFREDNLFYFLISIAAIAGFLPFVFTIMLEGRTQREKDERFLEFARSLAESVKSGNPVAKSILNMRSKNFGSLTPHIGKLASQLSIGIPISKAFATFADDIDSPTVSRAVTLIREADSAGGKIDNILDSVAQSMYQIEKLRKERQAAIYNLVVQGYIIFFIFIGIMLIMEFKVLPLTADIGGVSSITSASSSAAAQSGATTVAQRLTRPFLYLLVVQGFFTGLMIGKLSEGNIKAGLKHSFVLAIAALLISSGARAFL